MLIVGGVNTCDCSFIKGLNEVFRASFICGSILVFGVIMIF